MVRVDQSGNGIFSGHMGRRTSLTFEMIRLIYISSGLSFEVVFDQTWEEKI